jgi:glutathione S-transferase
MKLYADPITVNCRKVIAGFKLLDVDYDLSYVDYFEGGQKGADYVAINPNAALPAITDGDLTLWESNAILAYAADKQGRAQHYSTDLKTRADINRWLFWQDGSWFPSCYVYLVENCVKPLLGAETDPAALDAEADNFHKLAGILDNRLSESEWLCGNEPSIADIAMASPMHLYDWQQLPLDQHRPLKRWMTEKVESLPAWQDTMVYEGFSLEAP